MVVSRSVLFLFLVMTASKTFKLTHPDGMLFNSQLVLISKAINDKMGVNEVFFHQV